MFRKTIIILSLFLVLFTGLVSADLSTDLYAYYTLDSDVTDDFGSKDFTNSGTSSTTGILSNAREFSSGDYTQDSDFSVPTSAFTYNLWVKTTSTAYNIPISSYVYGTCQNFQILLTTTGTVQGGVWATGSAFPTSSSSVNDGDWHMITLKYDGSDVFVYVDGVNEVNASLSGTPNSCNDLYLGRRVRSGTNYYFLGDIDEVGVWDRSLGTTEIQELYNSGNGKSYPFTTGDDCDYSGSGDWVIETTCHVDTNTKLESGKTIFIKSGATMFIDVGVAIT